MLRFWAMFRCWAMFSNVSRWAMFKAARCLSVLSTSPHACVCDPSKTRGRADKTLLSNLQPLCLNISQTIKTTRNRWSEPKESSKLDIKISVCCTDRVKSYLDNAQIDRALFRKASSGSVRVTIKTDDGSLCLTGWEPQRWGLHNTSCQLRIWLCWSVVAACSEIIILNSKRHISRTTMETQRGSVCLTGWAADTPGF